MESRIATDIDVREREPLESSVPKREGVKNIFREAFVSGGLPVTLASIAILAGVVRVGERGQDADQSFLRRWQVFFVHGWIGRKLLGIIAWAAPQ